MKTISAFVSVTVIMLFVFSSCQDELMTYDHTDSVYFDSDSLIYSYYVHPSAVTEDTVSIAINLIGTVPGIDREINISVDSTDAVEGTHYDLVKPVILYKDSTTAKLQVILYRTEDIADEAKTIWFSIKNSEDLLTANYSDNNAFMLRFSDQMEKPDWWDSFFFPHPFSETRMQFYIDVMGSADRPGSFSPGFGHYYTIYKLNVALADYNASHDEPLSDEYGLISWD